MSVALSCGGGVIALQWLALVLGWLVAEALIVWCGRVNASEIWALGRIHCLYSRRCGAEGKRSCYLVILILEAVKADWVKAQRARRSHRRMLWLWSSDWQTLPVGWGLDQDTRQCRHVEGVVKRWWSGANKNGRHDA